jgi:signal peptidase I
MMMFEQEPLEPQLENIGEPPIDPTLLETNRKLMKTGKQKLILFLVATLISLTLVALNQGKALFLFDLSNQNLNDTTVSRFFSALTYGFLMFTVVYFFRFANLWRKRHAIQSDAEIASSLPRFQKQYNLFDMLGVIPVFMMAMIFVNAYFFSPAVVDGFSMEPTFSDNDSVIVYQFNIVYQHDDIVIIDMQNRLLIKRLLAMPGDTLSVSYAGVYVNGILKEADIRGNIVFFNGVVPEDSYFVMGDNRAYTSENQAMSHDSRYFGFLTGEQLLGKVVLKFGV